MQSKINNMLGKTLTRVVPSDDEVRFYTDDGVEFRMFHSQDCCEDVYLEDVCGDLDDLLHSPILVASEETNSDMPPLHESVESYTWTFYKLATRKGYVTLRWYGSSNGYYSESVTVRQIS